jgi:hypothetical protein
VSARIRAGSSFKRFLPFVLIGIRCVRVPQVENHWPTAFHRNLRFSTAARRVRHGRSPIHAHFHVSYDPAWNFCYLHHAFICPCQSHDSIPLVGVEEGSGGERSRGQWTRGLDLWEPRAGTVGADDRGREGWNFGSREQWTRGLDLWEPRAVNAHGGRERGDKQPAIWSRCLQFPSHFLPKQSYRKLYI